MTAPIQISTPEDAERHQLVWAVWPADLATPVQLFLALRERGRKPCLLESVEGPQRLARYSFVGVDPRAHFRGRSGSSELITADGVQALPGSPHDALRRAVRERSAPTPPRGLPPFCGGWVGWFAYEWSSALEPSVPRAANDPWRVPDATFEHYEDVVCLDHSGQRLYVVCAARGGASDYAAARERLEAIAADALASAQPSGELVLASEPTPCMPKQRFLDGVSRLREHIAQGECFQAVLAQRFEMSAQGDPFTLYRVLRLFNPSPHMFFFEADDLTLIGSSPERLISVQDGIAETRPIAGTRPRSADDDEDERLGIELMASAKERAEHDMLVDLARNDLGRVARIGSVNVREHATLERFARVQHITSRVDCELAVEADALDALAAAFPAGTVSGAPKVRAQQLLATLENDTRGPYAGAFGYIDGRGNLDMALSIRCFTMRDETLCLQSGAGIVFESDPVMEYEETLAKARALVDAAQAVDTPAFRAGLASAHSNAGVRS